jgi:hypothetical protein
MFVLLALLAVPTAAPGSSPPRLAEAGAAAPPRVPEDLDAVRGAFAGAADAEAAQWREVERYAETCVLRSAEATRAELRSLGYASTALPPGGYRDHVCRAARGLLIARGEYRSWDAFNAARREAWPVFAAYRTAVRNAETVARNRLEAGTNGSGDARPAPPLGEILAARIVGEQVLRLADTAVAGEDGQSRPVTMEVSPAARPLLGALLAIETARRDEANADWLRGEVDRAGWPTPKAVGPAGAEAAWLIVQHADHDPAFQARMLQLMTPLVARGEVSRRNYAFLYDRVMMKVAGRQRYATQYRCRGGRWEPAALEDPGRAEALRKEAGLGTVAENTARIEGMYGKSCSSED